VREAEDGKCEISAISIPVWDQLHYCHSLRLFTQMLYRKINTKISMDYIVCPVDGLNEYLL